MKIQFKNDIVTVFESALYRTTSTVADLGDLVIVTDPNWLPAEVGTIRDHVNRIAGGRPVYLFITHSDYDHIIGCGAFQDAVVVASDALSTNNNKADILAEVLNFDHSFYITRDYPIKYPEVDIKIVKDGQSLRSDRPDLQFFLASGHTEDGAILLLRDQGIILAGDYLSNIEFPFVYFHLDQYRSTLLKIKEIVLSDKSVRLLIPGHGDTAKSRAEIFERISKDLIYLDLLEMEAVTSKMPTDTANFIESYSSNPSLLAEHVKNVNNVKQMLRKDLSDI